MMKSIAPLLALTLFSGLLGVSRQADAFEEPRKKTLTAFASETELKDFLQRLAEKRQSAQRLRSQKEGGPSMADSAPQSQPAPAPAKPSLGASAAKALAEESVTNTQTAGVDEGGIVKVHGKHLVILRRGRLFTVDVSRGQMKPVAAVDAFGPGIEPGGAWYDEMLLADDTVIVIGYSYQRGGTEIGLFDITDAGELAYRATYHLRSNDYYSSRNYASRLIGNKLIFYTPLYLHPSRHDPFASFPAVRKWQQHARPEDFKRIAPATRIYRTDDEADFQGALALHTVSICDLSRRDMECEATAVLGPAGRVFYVSADAVYVWTTSHSYTGNEYRSRSGIFRIPLNGKAPSALKSMGAPIDQFSFLESADRHLNVLVRSNGRGDGMWAAERGNGGDMALLRVPLEMFGDGKDSAPAANYKPVPAAGGYALQNRFIGSHLLYGTGTGWGYAKEAKRQPVYAVRWDNADPAQSLALPHSVDRIEALGGDAVVIGTSGRDLHFTTLALESEAMIAYRFIRENAAQGETRSHGFFYKAESGDQGLIGLPIMRAGQPGYRQLHSASASVLYLRNKSLKLSELGALDARPAGELNDQCRASCVDWYGNSRPLFLKGRVFALMGYELVEGKLTGERITEVRRANFAPGGWSDLR